MEFVISPQRCMSLYGLMRIILSYCNTNLRACYNLQYVLCVSNYTTGLEYAIKCIKIVALG